MKGKLSKRFLALAVGGCLLAASAATVLAAGGLGLFSEETPQTEFIFDDTEAVCTGTWTEERAENPEQHGEGFRYVYYGAPATAVYTAEIEQEGWYEVSGWWTALSNRATNSLFIVACGEESHEVRVNQQEKGGQWNHLQTVYAEAGETITVTLSNSGIDGYIIADGLRIAREEGIIVDDDAAVLTGDWVRQALDGAVDSLERFGPCFRHAAGSGDPASATATFQAEAPADGVYDVYGWWTTHENRATNTPFTLSNGQTVYVNQEENGGQWNLIGQISAQAGDTLSVTIGNNADEYVVADAVKFQLAEEEQPEEPETGIILDDSQAVFAGDSWTLETADKTEERYGDGFRYSAWIGVDSQHNATAVYTAAAPADGYYEIYGWWTAHENRATNTPYIVSCGEQSQTVRVNQRQDGGQWNLLCGVMAVEGQDITVTIANNADGYVIADAVRIVPAEAPETYTITLNYNQQGGTVTGKTSGLLAGETVTLTAAANPGYLFEGWYEGQQKVCDTAAYTFQVASDRTLEARFTEEPEADKADLLAAIEDAQAAKTDGRYDDADVAAQRAFDDALAAAEDVYEDENASQDAVDTAQQNLTDAIEALSVHNVTTAELQAAVDYAKSLDLKNYQTDGQAAFTAALDAAETLLTKGADRQADIDDALYDLLHATAALRLNADKALLD